MIGLVSYWLTVIVYTGLRCGFQRAFLVGEPSVVCFGFLGGSRVAVPTIASAFGRYFIPC